MSKVIEAPVEVEISRSYDGKHVLEFNELKHVYKLDGKRRVGVTTFTKGGYPTSRGLIYWQKAQAINSVLSTLTDKTEDGLVPKDHIWPLPDKQVADLIRMAHDASEVASQEAADIGSIIHDFAFLDRTGGDTEALLGRINTLPEDVKAKIMRGIDKYKAWRAATNDELVMAEAPVASVIHDFCGKFDLLTRRDGLTVLSDYKSSKSIYPDQFIQLAAYKLAIKEWHNLVVDVLEVVRFGKEDGEFETKMITDPNVVMKYCAQAIRCRQTYEFNKDISKPEKLG